MPTPRIGILGLSFAITSCLSLKQNPKSATANLEIIENTSCISELGQSIWDSAGKLKSSKLYPASRTVANEVAGPTVIVRGPAIAEAMKRELSQAESEILLSFYDIEVNSWMAAQIKEGIEAAIARNPQIRVYVKLNANTNAGETLIPAEERIYKLFDYKKNIEVSAHFNGIDFADVNHSKYIVIDQHTVIMTDTNLQANADPVAQGGLEWYQLALVARGDVAKGLRNDFLDAWNNFNDGTKSPLGEYTGTTRASSGCTHIMLVPKAAGADSTGYDFYQSALFFARNNVHIITPNLNSVQIRDELKSLMGPRVKQNPEYRIKVILSKKFNDLPLQVPGFGGTNQQFLDRWQQMVNDDSELLDETKQNMLCGLEVRWFAETAGQEVDGNVQYASHAKFLSVDGKAMILGSFNLDEQTFKRSREMALLVDDAATTAAFDAEFVRIWERSVPVDTGCRR